MEPTERKQQKICPPAYGDREEKAITRNECVFRMTSFIQRENASQPAHQTWHTHPVAEWQYEFVPTFYSHDWWVTLEWKKVGAMRVHTKCSVREVACICVWWHAFIWCVYVGGWSRRLVVSEDSGLGQDGFNISRWEKKYIMNTVGPYHPTFLTRLGTGYLFFFLSYFSEAVGHLPAILFFVATNS